MVEYVDGAAVCRFKLERWRTHKSAAHRLAEDQRVEFRAFFRSDANGRGAPEESEVGVEICDFHEVDSFDCRLECTIADKRGRRIHSKKNNEWTFERGAKERWSFKVATRELRNAWRIGDVISEFRVELLRPGWRERQEEEERTAVASSKDASKDYPKNLPKDPPADCAHPQTTARFVVPAGIAAFADGQPLGLQVRVREVLERTTGRSAHFRSPRVRERSREQSGRSGAHLANPAVSSFRFGQAADDRRQSSSSFLSIPDLQAIPLPPRPPPPTEEHRRIPNGGRSLDSLLVDQPFVLVPPPPPPPLQLPNEIKAFYNVDRRQLRALAEPDGLRLELTVRRCRRETPPVFFSANSRRSNAAAPHRTIERAQREELPEIEEIERPPGVERPPVWLPPISSRDPRRRRSSPSGHVLRLARSGERPLVARLPQQLARPPARSPTAQPAAKPPPEIWLSDDEEEDEVVVVEDDEDPPQAPPVQQIPDELLEASGATEQAETVENREEQAVVPAAVAEQPLDLVDEIHDETESRAAEDTDAAAGDETSGTCPQSEESSFQSTPTYGLSPSDHEEPASDQSDSTATGCSKNPRFAMDGITRWEMAAVCEWVERKRVDETAVNARELFFVAKQLKMAGFKVACVEAIQRACADLNEAACSVIAAFARKDDELIQALSFLWTEEKRGTELMGTPPMWNLLSADYSRWSEIFQVVNP
ncbi:hypothetical protein M3Y99_00705700 [Aphelenchoides fujianensis]|nr:hypothetical protein M3Y99_00705700 [Aphelenchoides fujianensis]